MTSNHADSDALCLGTEDAIKKEVQGVKRSCVRGPFQCHERYTTLHILQRL